MPSLSIMDGKGHTELVWDPENAESTKDALKAFEDLSAKGYRFWLISEKGNPKGSVIKKFQVNAGRLIFVVARDGAEVEVEAQDSTEKDEKGRAKKKDEVVAAPPSRGG